MSKIVIALGGNALGNTPTEQKKAVEVTAKSIVDLAEENELIISHGNGPQVGMINLAMDMYSQARDDMDGMPFAECGAMSQGYIGYHLQNAIENELSKRKLDKMVISIISEVLVDKDDKAFENPSKPIGSFYSLEESQHLAQKYGFTFKEDAGRGYRRVVPSPSPVDILQKRAIKDLYNAGAIVIAAGGGGIPVVKENGKLRGVDAVIDKDFTSAKLASLIGAELLIILTAVDKVAIHFGQENEEWISKMSVAEAEKYLADGEFKEGSMKPKIEAALSFVKAKEGNRVLITSLEKAIDGLKGLTGTYIG